MPADIGAKITLQGEKQYREQMRQITQQTKTMRAETTALESSWGKNTTAQQKAAQQAQLLSNQIEAQKRSVETARANVQRFTEEYGESDRRTLKWKQTLAEAETELHSLEAALQSVPNQLEIMGQKMQENGQKIQSVGRAMTSVGSTLTKTVTGPVVAIGAAAVKTTADFDESMSKVQALSGATGKDFDALRTKARQMGASTKYSAGESADALSYMALAGWDTNQMLDGLDGVMNLAAASGMDLAEASDIVTDYLSAFGLEAKDSSRMADQLAYAQAHSNTTTTQLGEAFGNSAAQMHTAGQSMETTTAILEAFANQGMKGSEAGTALSAMVRDISQKMKDGRIQIGDTTVAVQDQNGNFRNMVDILADVEAATEGMGSAEKTVALQQTFTARSIKGVSMALTEGSDNIYRYESALRNADGTAKGMAETMQNNLKGQLTILKSQLQELGISFGDILVPHIRKAVTWLQNTVDKFNSLDNSTKEQIVKFAGLAAAIGPVLLVGGKLTTSIGQMVEGGGKAIEWIGKMVVKHGANAVAAGVDAAATEGATAATLGFNAALAASPIGLVAAALGALGGFAAIAYAGYKDLERGARDTNEELYQSIDAVNGTNTALYEASDAMKEGFSKADQAIQDVESSAKAATKIADEIEELTSKSSLTADEQARLKVLVGEMNALFPEMALAIDETGQSLNMSSSEIRNFIDQSYKMAKASAYANAVKEALQQMADAELAVAKAGIEHDNLLKEQQALQTQVAGAIDKHKAAAEGMSEADRELYMLGTEVNEGYGTQKIALNDATQALEENEAAQEECNATLEEAQKNVDLNQAALEKLAEELGVSVDELMGVSDAAEETGDSMQNMAGETDEAADAIDDATQEIIDAYNRTKDSAYDSVMGQTSLWDELEKSEETSIEQMRKGLQSHIEAYKNWNSNASSLMSSSRYQTDANFRAIVNSIISAGQDAAPELQALAEAFRSGDAELEGIVQDYGEMSGLAGTTSQYIADATTVAEYGLEGYTSAFGEGSLAAVNAMRNVFANTTPLETTVKGSMFSLEKKSKPWFIAYGKNTGSAYGTGLSDSKGSIDQGYGVLETAVRDGGQKVLNQKSEAESAGKQVAGGIATGVRAQRADINSAFTSLRSAISTSITQIQNLRSSAKAAGSSVGADLAAGVTNESGKVQSAAQKIVDSAKKVLSSFGSSAEPTAWGRHVGDSFANAIGSASGSASANSSSVANAARAPLQALGNSRDPWTWGRHMGDNFANGISSTYGNVVAQARALANAVSNILKHSTPKEGPLKDDDVWGLHLGQNFAEGMERAVPEVERAALSVANVIDLPTRTMMDIDAAYGRNVASDMFTMEGLRSVIGEAVGNREFVIQISNREFARLLRENGAIA